MSRPAAKTARARVANGPLSAFIDRSSLRIRPSKPIAPRMISLTTIGEVVAGESGSIALKTTCALIAIGASLSAAKGDKIARREFRPARRDDRQFEMAVGAWPAHARECA